MNYVKEYFLDVLKNHYKDFNGRATRKQFWFFVLGCFIVTFILGIIFGFLKAVGAILFVLLSLALFLPQLAIAFRRVRDAGYDPRLGLLLVPSLVSSILAHLPQSLLEIRIISLVLSLLGIVSLLCTIGLIIICVLPSNE